MPKKLVPNNKSKGGKPKERNDTHGGLTKIKSAKEMGLAAESMGIIKKGKTHKGRKIMEEREAKLVENPKKSIFLKGSKTS